MVLICLFLSSFSPSRFPSSPSLTVSHSRPLPCPDFHSHSLPPAIFLPLELSLSCLFPLPSSSPSSFVFHIPSASSSGLSISSGPSISPLLLLLGAILLCSRCSARRKYSLFAPPLDMAKEAICALLAILGHFFEAFSPLDLFFCPRALSPRPSTFPCFPPSRMSSLSVLSGFRRLVSPCSIAVRTRPLSAHAGF